MLSPRQIETRRMINRLVIFLLTVVLILEIWQSTHDEEEIALSIRPLKDHRNHLGPRLLLRFRPTGRCSQPLQSSPLAQNNEASADPPGPRL